PERSTRTGQRGGPGGGVERGEGERAGPADAGTHGRIRYERRGHENRGEQRGPPIQRGASAPSPSASTMIRNTAVLSRNPDTGSAPGPTAVSTTSSPLCTP